MLHKQICKGWNPNPILFLSLTNTNEKCFADNEQIHYTSKHAIQSESRCHCENACNSRIDINNDKSNKDTRFHFGIAACNERQIEENWDVNSHVDYINVNNLIRWETTTTADWIIFQSWKSSNFCIFSPAFVYAIMD